VCSVLHKLWGDRVCWDGAQTRGASWLTSRFIDGALRQWFPTFSVSWPLLTKWMKAVDPLSKTNWYCYVRTWRTRIDNPCVFSVPHRSLSWRLHLARQKSLMLYGTYHVTNWHCCVTIEMSNEFNCLSKAQLL